MWEEKHSCFSGKPENYYVTYNSACWIILLLFIFPLEFFILYKLCSCGFGSWLSAIFLFSTLFYWSVPLLKLPSLFLTDITIITMSTHLTEILWSFIDFSKVLKLFKCLGKRLYLNMVCFSYVCLFPKCNLINMLCESDLQYDCWNV